MLTLMPCLNTNTVDVQLLAASQCKQYRRIQARTTMKSTWREQRHAGHNVCSPSVDSMACRTRRSSVTCHCGNSRSVNNTFRKRHTLRTSTAHGQEQLLTANVRQQYTTDVTAVATRLATAVLVGVLSLHTCECADARVVTERILQQEQSSQSSMTAGFDPGAAAAARGVPSTSSRTSRPQSSVAAAAADALQQLAAAQQAVTDGDYQAALATYTSVVQQHADLALAEYARLGRALMLYEVGETSKSLVALEDQELSMRGYPEVHAALAAVLYVERPTQRLRAEQQFDIAVEFDSHFQDAEWVARNKQWGKKLLGAYEKFLRLQ